MVATHKLSRAFAQKQVNLSNLASTRLFAISPGDAGTFEYLGLAFFFKIFQVSTDFHKERFSLPHHPLKGTISFSHRLRNFIYFTFSSPQKLKPNRTHVSVNIM
jgi:hypothetical protein